ncbi:GNAT family N-acetyltransferase [Cohnella soli]|uniref:GNAT family N-acetyltransferase n=1 Tax=Cohnella soli TaxID=425005 RepID=A0ABW0HRR5_9BACL
MHVYKRFKIPELDRMFEVTIRNYEWGDFAKLIDLQAQCFPPPYPPELWWNAEQLSEHVSRFPEGALCAEVDGVIVGSMTALRRNIPNNGHESWATATNEGYIRNHEPDGDTVYVVDLCVAPAYRKLGVGKQLMQAMYETVVHLRCARLLGGGRMPGYAAVAGDLSPEAYLAEVCTGKRRDPVISFMLACGRMPVGVVADYLDDEQSADCAALMEWRNPFDKENK